MTNYTYATTLKALWDKTVDLYAQGGRNVNLFFNGVDLEFLRSIGTTPDEIYDFAEDFNQDGEPDWETFLLVQSVRRDYFLTVQQGRYTESLIDVAALPEKTEAVRDIVWLPRVIRKAYAKLHGEMPSTLMYCCGGDRRFFKTHDIHPADFLRAAWAYEGNETELIDWVVAQSNRKTG